MQLRLLTRFVINVVDDAVFMLSLSFSETSGATFQDSRRRMILRSVQASAAGAYECEAQIPLFGGRKLRASTRIQLQVYGKFVSMYGFLMMYCASLRTSGLTALHANC